jgi:hypothetical protein
LATGWTLNEAAAGNTRPAPYVRGGLTTLFMGAVLAVLPCVNVGGPVIFLTPPIFAASALFVWLAHRGLMRFDGLYVALFLLVIWCLLPWLTTAEYISSKAIVHSVAILVAITLYYATCRVGLLELLRAGRAELIIKICYLALLGVSVFILVEFIGSNLFGLDFRQFIPYVEATDFEAMVLGILKRPRGLASEPGVMALYYDFMLFFVLPLMSKGWKWRCGYFLVVLPAYLMLFSAASLVCCSMALVFFALLRINRHFFATTRWMMVWAILLGAVSIAAIDVVGEAINSVVLSKADIVNGGGDSASAATRSEMYGQIAEVVAKHPFGIGFGITAGLDSVGDKFEGIDLYSGQISLFGMFFIAGGIPAGVFSFLVAGWAIVRAAQVPGYGPYLAAGALALSAHQLFVTEFWLPFFWFPLAVIAAFFEVRHQRWVATSS